MHPHAGHEEEVSKLQELEEELTFYDNVRDW